MTAPTDIVPHHGGGDIDVAALEAEMRYAEVIAGSDLVPESYRRKPGNVLVAWGLGSAMGLGRMEALYRIDVIKGKPSASAELIASNVRRAGHHLRTVVNEQEQWAETTITRRDDPENPVTVRRDMEWARRMGLTGKDNYEKQAATMLQWRSISAAARLACSEALYGVQYTADELGDLTVQSTTVPQRQRPAGRAQASMFTRTETPAVAAAPEPEPERERPALQGTVQGETGEAPDPAAINAMFAAFTTAGFNSDARTTKGKTQRLTYISKLLGREVTATSDLTARDVHTVTEALTHDATDAEVVEYADEDEQ